MKAYTCIIIDDEELGRNLLEYYVDRVDHLELKGKFSNPMKAFQSLQEDSIDIIFLDIQMPEMTGIEFLKTLSKSPTVIFTTAYDKYALEGYALSVIDYLLKPFSFVRFMQAVNKAVELVDLKRGHPDIKNTSGTDALTMDYLMVKADHKIHRISLNDIRFIESQKEYVVYHTNTDKVMSLGSLKSLEAKLPKPLFLRVHKSFIVAKKYVRSIEGNQLNLSDIKIPIGGVYREMVIRDLF